MFEVQQARPMRYHEANQITTRDNIMALVKIIYFTHLCISCVYSTLLIVLQPKIRERFTGTLLLVIVYGFMIVWLLAFNFIAVVRTFVFIKIVNREKWAIFLNRIIAKIVIMIYPIFGVVVFFHDFFLFKRSIKTFMIYTLVISIFMIIFELCSCTCGHQDKKRLFYESNQFNDQRSDGRSKKYINYYK